jgi:hypothetical protein
MEYPTSQGYAGQVGMMEYWKTAASLEQLSRESGVE